MECLLYINYVSLLNHSVQDLVLQAMTSAVGLGLKARLKLWPWPWFLSGLGLEGLAWFSLFERYINPDTPSDSDDMRGSSAGVLSGHYQLDQFHQHWRQHGVALLQQWLLCRPNPVVQTRLKRILCSPCEFSASWKGVLSMSDTLLEAPMFLKCSGMSELT